MGRRRDWQPRLSEKQFSVWEFLGPKQLRQGLPDAEPEVRGGDGKGRTNAENSGSQKGAVQRRGASAQRDSWGPVLRARATPDTFSTIRFLFFNSFFSRRKTTLQCCVVCMRAKSLGSHLTLCDPMDCGLSGSSAHGVFQARILEWVAISFSRGSS